MIGNDNTILYFARIKSNENKRSFYKIGKTQSYFISTDNKYLKRTEKDRYRELKREFGNEFFQDDDIIIVRQIVIPTSLKVVYNATFCSNKIGDLKKSNGGFFDDCYKNSFEMFEILMNFFDEHSDKVNDMVNTNYTITSNGKEYHNERRIQDTFYTADDYLNKKEDEWSSDEDDGSHLDDDESNDSFITTDDDLESSDEEYIPKKKQRI